MKYTDADSLFKGICDEIRAKDGTTALIQHQDIPDRIAAISGSGSGGASFTSPFYTHSNKVMKIEDMVVSGFTEYDAIYLTEVFLPGEYEWEIVVKFTWPESNSRGSNVLFGPSGINYTAPTMTIGNRANLMRVSFGIPNGDESWTINGEYFADATPGEWYFIKLKYSREKYTASISENGKMYKDIIQVEYGVMYQVDNKNAVLKFGGILSDSVFTGKIDLKETYIKIGNEIWWGKG